MSNPNFQELLASLQAVGDESATLAKSQAAAAEDDKTVAAAAAEAGVVVPPAGGEGGEGNPEDEVEEGEGGETLGKSLGADEAGNDYVDATDLVKSLIDRLDGTEGNLAKAMTAMTGVMTQQNDLIKSLQTEVKALAAAGRGRKTLLTVHEKLGGDTLAKGGQAEPERITPKDVLAKAQEAHDAGRIDGKQLTTIDVCMRNGWSIDADILRKVAG